MVIRVSLALANSLLAQGIESYLQQQPDILVCSSRTTDDAASPAPLNEVILLELGTAQAIAQQQVQSRREQQPQQAIVVLSDFTEAADVLGMLDAGAVACVSTCSQMDDVVQAIRSAARGHRHLCHHLSALALQGARQPTLDTRDRLGLGHREGEVLCLIADGYSSKEIARHLDIAPSTVDVHRRNIMRKIGLHKVADLTRFAIRHQLVPL